MTSAYYNLEKTRDFFRNASDLPVDELARTKVLYWVDQLDTNSKQMTDNAAYNPATEAFFLYPLKATPGLSLPMNLGVIGHEAAHKIFSIRLMNRVILERFLRHSLPTTYLRPLMKASADYWGYSITCAAADTCAPQFVALSYGERGLTRDLSDTKRCTNDQLKQTITDPSKLSEETLTAAHLSKALSSNDLHPP
jgi:hypothetical protein